MSSKVNLKARINRHSRILQENFSKAHPLRVFYHRLNYFLVFWFILFLLPIYPSFSLFLHQNTQVDFNRSYIDESSILDYFDWSELYDETFFIDSFLNISSVWDVSRDLTWFNTIIEHEVQPWESFYSISSRYQVSIDTILWANNFSKTKVLKPGEVIKIPPVDWVIHKVEKWDSISSLAKKYNINKEDILAQNNFEEGVLLNVWDFVILPWAKKLPPPPKPVITKSQPTNNLRNTNQSWSSEYVNSSWTYKLVRRPPKHKFYWWNCTRYVAQYKNVTWGWNANQWINNAKAKWVPTWTQPKLWAIVQFEWTWYNPRYWHVWIVVDLTPTHIIVKDMNYRKINEVTTRKVPINDRSIKWYIYVD